MANNGNGGGGFVLGLFVGGTIGALLGLLLAPRSGSETRAELRELGETWRTRADELAADVRGYGMAGFEDVSGRVGPAVDSLKARGSSAFGSVREAETGAVASAREDVGAVGSRVNGGDGHQPAQPAAPDAGIETETETESPGEQPPASEQSTASV